MEKEVGSLVVDDENQFPDHGVENLGEEVESRNGYFAGETVVHRGEQQAAARLSVRDLASKFEKGLAGSYGDGTELSDEEKLRQTALMEKHVLIEKLMNALKSVRGRVSDRNKDDVEETISMVEGLTVELTERERELLEEKEQQKKLADYLKKVLEDAKNLVDEEMDFARNEVECARGSVLRVEEALHELEQRPRTTANQVLEDLAAEVQEARRIKMLHQSSKVTDMELELQALRIQLDEECMHCIRLQKELNIYKGLEDEKSNLYELGGLEMLGSYLCITPCSDEAPDLSNCNIQWYRKSSDGSQKDIISGATKLVYAPEPLDVGVILEADIVNSERKFSVKATGLIDPAPGLGSFIEALVRIPETEFNVVVEQMNGKHYPSHSIHTFHVGKMRIKLCEGRIIKAKESYSISMKLCGVRGGGNAAVQALFWQANEELSFVLVFESARERNAAIMLSRRFAFDWSITLLGPGDCPSIGT